MEEFSQDWLILRVLSYERPLCTLNELQTIYSLDQLYDFVEMIEAQEAMKESAEQKAERRAKQEQEKLKARQSGR